jgi:hypothetical protein
MIKVCVYETATGKVRWNTECPEEMASAQSTGVSGLAQITVEAPVNGRTHRIVSGVATARPVLAFNKLAITADDVDAATLTVGETFTATIDGVDHVITGGVLTITSPMAGSYTVEIRHWPHQDFTATVVAS